jgi:hypothetical protein
MRVAISEELHCIPIFVAPQETLHFLQPPCGRLQAWATQAC